MSEGYETFRIPHLFGGGTRPGFYVQKIILGKIHHAIHGKIHEISMAMFQFAFCMFTRPGSSHMFYYEPP